MRDIPLDRVKSVGVAIAWTGSYWGILKNKYPIVEAESS
jgi:hypothetical protein